MEFYGRAADENLVLYYGIDLFVNGCIVLAFTEAAMGRCDRALKLCSDAQARAAEISHLFSQAFSLNTIAAVHQMRREPARAEAAARELLTMSHEHGFSELIGWAKLITGWAMVEQDRGEQGIQMMLEAMKFHESIGGSIATAWRQGVLAEECAKSGRLDDAQNELRRAIERIRRAGISLTPNCIESVAKSHSALTPGPGDGREKLPQSDCRREETGGSIVGAASDREPRPASPRYQPPR
jgi:ATP/maltotriose-dependent transcriptional regulator MalT